MTIQKDPYQNQIITLPNGIQLKHHELCDQLYEMGYDKHFVWARSNWTDFAKEKDEYELISAYKFLFNISLNSKKE
jgi:hypothetical protein